MVHEVFDDEERCGGIKLTQMDLRVLGWRKAKEDFLFQYAWASDKHKRLAVLHPGWARIQRTPVI